MQSILTLHLTEPLPSDWDNSTWASTIFLLYTNMLKRIDTVSTNQVGELYNTLLNKYTDSKIDFMGLNIASLLEQYWDVLSERVYNESKLGNALAKRTRSGKIY